MTSLLGLCAFSSLSSIHQSPSALMRAHNTHRQRLAVPSHRELLLRLGRRLIHNEGESCLSPSPSLDSNFGTSLGGLFPSPLNEDTSKISIKIATAPQFEGKCGGRLYYVNDAKLGACALTRERERESETFAYVICT